VRVSQRITSTIAGYGNVLIPLAGGRLLTVADAYDPVTYTQSLVLQLIDASDGDAPVVAHELELGPNTYSDASYDARAVTLPRELDAEFVRVQPGDGSPLSLQVLALSSVGGFRQVGSVTAPQVEFELEACLGLLGYPTDPESVEQIAEDEALAASLLQQCNAYYQSTPRRGLFRDDVLRHRDAERLLARPR